MKPRSKAVRYTIGSTGDYVYKRDRASDVALREAQKAERDRLKAEADKAKPKKIVIRKDAPGRKFNERANSEAETFGTWIARLYAANWCSDFTDVECYRAGVLSRDFVAESIEC